MKIYVEKLINYQDLEIEIQNFWNTQKVKTIPIIVAALRTICEVLKENLYNKGSGLKLQEVKETAVLGAARTLRYFLTPQGQKTFS